MGALGIGQNCERAGEVICRLIQPRCKPASTAFPSALIGNAQMDDAKTGMAALEDQLGKVLILSQQDLYRRQCTRQKGKIIGAPIFARQHLNLVPLAAQGLYNRKREILVREKTRHLDA